MKRHPSKTPPMVYRCDVAYFVGDKRVGDVVGIISRFYESEVKGE